MSLHGLARRFLPPRPSAFASFGAGSWLVPPCMIEGAERIRVGTDVVLLEHADLRVTGGELVLGDRCRFGRGLHVTCETGIQLGAAVSGSDHVAVLDGAVVEHGAYLGWGSTIGEGVRVGRGAYVGEGAVVLEDVAPRTLVRGNPASVVA